MSSTFSPDLRIELIGTGDQAGVWGVTTNTNLGTILESAIAGYTSVSVTSANQAFTANNGLPDEARYASIALLTTTTANFAVYAPPSPKQYVIYNSTNYTATIYNSTSLGNTTAAGTGVAIPAGKTVTVWSDGTNFAQQNNYFLTPALASETYSLSAAVTAGSNAQGQGALTSDINVITTASANPSGVTLPTATAGRKVTVINKGANAINVYPASGGAVDALSTNASIQIPANSSLEFRASSTTQWYSTATGDTGSGVNVRATSPTISSPTLSSPTISSPTFSTAVAFTNGSDSSPAITGSDTDTGIYFGTNLLGLSTGGSTALYANSSQYIGLGTVTPATKLDVRGTPVSLGGASSGNLVIVANTSTAYNSSPTASMSLFAKYNTGGAVSAMATINAGKENATDGNQAGYFSIITAGSTGTLAEWFRVSSTGKVGINTNNPQYNLQIGTYGVDADSSIALASSATGTGTIKFGPTTGAAGDGQIQYDNANNYLKFTTNSTVQLTIDDNGNLGVFSGSTSLWTSTYRAVELTSGALVSVNDGSGTYLATNTYRGGAGWNYKSTGYASAYYQDTASGYHSWSVSTSSGSSGAVTLTERMRLNATTLTMSVPITATNGTASSPAVTGTDTDTGIYFGTNLLGLSTGGTNALYIDSSQNVGIGTTSPTGVSGYKSLTINGASGGLIDLAKAGTMYGRFAANNSGFTVETAASTPIYFAPAGSQSLKLDSSGRILVGGIENPSVNTSQSGEFSTSTTYGYVFTNTTTANWPMGVWNQGTSGTRSLVLFMYGASATTTGSITTNGGTTAYNTTSDYRLKEDIQPMVGALAKVAALKPCTYKWKESGVQAEGFIAHELAEVCPQAVVGEKDAVNADGKPMYQGVDTSLLVAMLTSAIQEQQALIKQLRDDVNALKAQ